MKNILTGIKYIGAMFGLMVVGGSGSNHYGGVVQFF